MSKNQITLSKKDMSDSDIQYASEEISKGIVKYASALTDVSKEFSQVKLLSSVVKSPKTFTDKILRIKVNEFLYASDITKERLDKLNRKFSNKKRKKLWENVIFSVNQHDDKEKSKIVGRIFDALLDERIGFEEFFDMTHATNSLNLSLLDTIKSMYAMGYDIEYPQQVYYSLTTLGLIGVDNSNVGTLDSTGISYPLNRLGWKYVGIVFNYPESHFPGYKVGEGTLVCEVNEGGHIKTTSMPLKIAQENDIRYREIVIYSIDGDGKILCKEEEDGDLFIIYKGAVWSGEHPKVAVTKMSDEQGFETKSIRSLIMKHMTSPLRDTWVFAVTLEKKPEDAEYISYLDALNMNTDPRQNTAENEFKKEVLSEIIKLNI